MGRFGTKKCALLQCVFWRSRLTHAHHLWRKRVRRRYYRFVNRHLVSFVISESTNGVYMDWGRFYPRRCWGLLAVLPYGLCSFPSLHIRPQRGRKFPSLHIRPQRGRRSPSPFMERGGRQAWGEVYPSPSSPASIAVVHRSPSPNIPHLPAADVYSPSPTISHLPAADVYSPSPFMERGWPIGRGVRSPHAIIP